MKKNYLILFLLPIALFGCKAKKVANPYSVSEVVSHDTQGIVTLRGVSDEFDDDKKGKGKTPALKQAHKKAIQQLFYLGFPGTDFKNPMITKGNQVETTNKAYFDTFWTSGYQQYITDNKVQYYGCEIKKSKCVKAVSTFKLNYNMLRKDLEKNNVINKIGF